jgi:hypothetical protein
MAPMVGGDYYERTGRKAPKGLVSEPPNPPACLAAVHTINTTLTNTQITTKCKQLYEDIDGVPVK